MKRLFAALLLGLISISVTSCALITDPKPAPTQAPTVTVTVTQTVQATK